MKRPGLALFLLLFVIVSCHRSTKPLPQTTPQEIRTEGPLEYKRIIEPTGVPGEVKVDVCISNYSFKGFAKIEEDIPAGVKVTLIKAGVSSFSADNNKIKFVFINVPLQNMLCVSYKLHSDDPVVYVHYPGSLRYIKNDQVSVVKMDPASVILKAQDK